MIWTNRLASVVIVVGVLTLGSGVRGGASSIWAVASPLAVILLSTNPNSDYQLTSAADGVLFDVDGSGIRQRVGWTTPGSDVAILAIDLDGDGAINSGKELITPRSVRGASNCFAALQSLAMQTNGGVRLGSVTSDDPIFRRLLLWRDANHNGVSEASELAAVSDSFSAIGLGYSHVPRGDQNGNEFGFRGWAHIRTGSGRNEAAGRDDNSQRSRYIWEVYLATR